MITTEFRPKRFKDVAGQDLNKKIIKSIVENPKDSPKSIILQGGFGTGKCVSGDTYIRTTDGLRQIKDLFRGLDLKEDTFYSADNLEVSIKGREEKISDLYYSGKKESIKLDTELDLNIEGSKKHPVLVWNPDKFESEWKKLDDVEVGDYLIMDLTSVDVNNLEYSNEKIVELKTIEDKVKELREDCSSLPPVN